MNVVLVPSDAFGASITSHLKPGGTNSAETFPRVLTTVVRCVSGVYVVPGSAGYIAVETHVTYESVAKNVPSGQKAADVWAVRRRSRSGTSIGFLCWVDALCFKVYSLKKRPK